MAAVASASANPPRIAVKLKRKMPSNEHNGPVLGQAATADCATLSGRALRKIGSGSGVAHGAVALVSFASARCSAVRFPHGPPPHLTNPELAEDLQFKMYANPEERKVRSREEQEAQLLRCTTSLKA
jgi:hypothetical protein